MTNRKQKRATGARAKRVVNKSGPFPRTPESTAPQSVLALTSEEIRLLVALFNQGKYAEAENLARQITARSPGHGFGWKVLGAVLESQGRTAESLEPMQKAAILLPRDADAHSNLGITLKNLGRLHEAEASYRRALQINPDFAEAHNNLGNILKDLSRLEEAEASYRRALQINPDCVPALSNLLFCLTYSQNYTTSFCLEEARCFGRLVTKMTGEVFSDWSCKTEPERLRVGMVSGDFRNHPAGYFIESLLTQIDRAQVELIAFPTHDKTDDLTTRIKPYFVDWKPLFGLNDEAAARLIHSEGVHILLDLSGHTARNRLPVFAWKPAPVQVSWLGYVATTGVAQMDYLLTDKARVPEAHRGHFTETIWYLPDTRLCFTAPDVDLPVQPLPALANGYMTFACFQNLAKLSDSVLKAWASILATLPTARMRLQCKQLADDFVRRQTTDRLKQFGIDPARVAMYGSVSREKYLAVYDEVDMNLDTFPFPGTTTTCEAIWMGVPTLTLAGDRMAERSGASVLVAAGLADWVATSKEDYVAKAIAMASDPLKLASLRAGLRTQALASPLFDSERFARNFTSALWDMWQRHSAPSAGEASL